MKNLIKLTVIVLCILACNSNREKNNPLLQAREGKITDTTAAVPLEPLIEGEESLTEESFGKIMELKGEQMSTNEIFKVSETEMIVKDSFLIMKNLSDKNMFTVFSLPQFKLIKSFGLNGRGPDEFQYPHIIKSEDKNTLCIVFESTNSKVYNLDRNLNLHVSSFKFPKAKEMFDEKQLASFSNTNFYYVSNATGGKAIYHSYLERDSMATNEIYNLAFSKEHKNWGNYIGDFGANKEKGRLVFAYKYFKRLVFMDTTGKKVRIINFQKKDEKSKDLISQLGPDNITHYWGMSAQSDYVYVLYSGRTPIEVGKQFKEENYFIYVEQFDWNGNPVRKFKLDHWGYFCVYEKSNSIIVASVNDDEPFFVYNLPGNNK